ncbi:MAG: GNAT family protein, partial [Bacteroidota bacterium]
ASGRVEIGYHVAPAYRRQGIATEAVPQLVALAQARPSVRHIVARSTVGNVASNRILLTNGFRAAGQYVDSEDGPMRWWVLEPEKPDHPQRTT